MASVRDYARDMTCLRGQYWNNFEVFALCSSVFLNFSSSFFHLLAHCSEVTRTTTPSVALKASATVLQASFFRIFPEVKLARFSFLIDISNLVSMYSIMAPPSCLRNVTIYFRALSARPRCGSECIVG